MFVRRCLLTLLMVIFCQDLGFKSPTTCRIGAFAENATQTLVVTVSAEPGAGQDLIKELVKASQNATLRPTDSRGTPLRPMDEDSKGAPPAPLGPRRRPKLEASPTADPPESGKRCPRDKPPATPRPPPPNATAIALGDGNAVAAVDKLPAPVCEAKCADEAGVEETVNICDEGCEAKDTENTEAKAKKDFDEVVEGGTDTAVTAAIEGEEMKKEEACRPCKTASPCGGIVKVEAADGAEAGGGDGACPAAAGPAPAPAPAPANDPPAGSKICSAGPPKEQDPSGQKDGKEPDPCGLKENKVPDPCGLAESKKGADPCRPADGKEDKPPTVPATDAETGEAVNVEVKAVEEPQCRISLEEETQVNAECRSCSARVMPGGGVKLSCFQCEHRPSDQTCYFARKTVGDDDVRGWEMSYSEEADGFCPAVTEYNNVTCPLENVLLFNRPTRSSRYLPASLR